MSSPEEEAFLWIGIAVGVPAGIALLCWLWGKYYSTPGKDLVNMAANYDLNTRQRRATPLSDAEARQALYDYRDSRV